MADIYGSDISTFAGPDNAVDIDPLFPEITGPRVVLEAVARRFMTPRGALPGFPNYGLDLQSYMGKRINEVEKKRIAADIKAEAEADQRVLSATVTTFETVAKNHYRVKVSIELAEGPFDLTLEIGSVTRAVFAAAV